MSEVPDSFHEFNEICTCKTKKEWIEFSKRKKYCLQLDGKFYNFRENTVVNSAGHFVDWTLLKGIKC